MPYRLASDGKHILMGAIGTAASWFAEVISPITIKDVNEIFGAAAGLGTAIYMALCIFDKVRRRNKNKQ